MISVVCATKSFMRLLVFHVDEKTVSVETCEERCGNDVLGGGRGASVACNLSPQLWQVYLAWSGYVPHPRKVFDPVTSMLRWCRLGSTLRGIVTGKHGSYRSHVTCGIDTASHTWQSGDQRRERRLQLIFTTKHLICSSTYSYC